MKNLHIEDDIKEFANVLGLTPVFIKKRKNIAIFQIIEEICKKIQESENKCIIMVLSEYQYSEYLILKKYLEIAFSGEKNIGEKNIIVDLFLDEFQMEKIEFLTKKLNESKKCIIFIEDNLFLYIPKNFTSKHFTEIYQFSYRIIIKKSYLSIFYIKIPADKLFWKENFKGIFDSWKNNGVFYSNDFILNLKNSDIHEDFRYMVKNDFKFIISLIRNSHFDVFFSRSHYDIFLEKINNSHNPEFIQPFQIKIENTSKIYYGYDKVYFYFYETPYYEEFINNFKIENKNLFYVVNL